jgi:transposase-like protein
VLDGAASITEVAIRFGVNRRTLHRWLFRYASGGLGALADRSSKPDRCPHQIAAEVEARIVSLRPGHPGWGPRTILNRLRLELSPSRRRVRRSIAHWCATSLHQSKGRFNPRAILRVSDSVLLGEAFA